MTSGSYNLIDKVHGYVNRKDITSIRAGFLIGNSFNVLRKDSGAIGVRRGYKVIGSHSNEIKPILSSKDFNIFNGDERNLRFVTGGSLELFYDGDWVELKNGLSDGYIYFSDNDFWDTKRLLSYLVFVDGSSNIFLWNGAIAKIGSTGTNTITNDSGKTFAELGFEDYGINEVEYKVINLDNIQGKQLSITLTDSSDTNHNYSITIDKKNTLVETAKDISTKWNTTIPDSQAISSVDATRVFVTAKEGFKITSVSNTDTDMDYITQYPVNITKPSVVINGTTYEYTGGVNSDTLTGVTPDPSSEASGSLTTQSIKTISNSSIRNIPDNNKNDIVEILDNRLYIGSKKNRFIYISETGRYDSFHFSRPQRIVGEGGRIELGGTLNAIIMNDGYSYFQFGNNKWIKAKFILSNDLSTETLLIKELYSGTNGGVINPYSIGRMKHSVLYISKNKELAFLKKLETNEQPQVNNLAYEIKTLFKSLDFKHSFIKFFDNYLFISVPEHNLVLMYNWALQSWEAPQKLPITSFSVIDGKLIGHSSVVKESYELFTGDTDNGFAIESRAEFSYNNAGDRAILKSFNELFVDGYIDENTELNIEIKYDVNGISGISNHIVLGNDDSVAKSFLYDDISIGKKAIGKQTIGGSFVKDNKMRKLRLYKSFINQRYYEYSVVFWSDKKHSKWEILSFGENTDLPYQIIDNTK